MKSSDGSTRGGQIPYRDFSSQSWKSILHSGSELSSGHQTISNTLHVSVCRAGGGGGVGLGAGAFVALYGGHVHALYIIYTLRAYHRHVYILRAQDHHAYIYIVY